MQVKEVLHRWANWETTSHSHAWRNDDARSDYFPAKVAPGEEVTPRDGTVAELLYGVGDQVAEGAELLRLDG